MKILVTGGAGFIGSNFIRHMASALPGYEAVNLDKLTYAGNLENLKGMEDAPYYTFVKGDICDRELIESLDFDGIINLAAESHVDRSIMDSYPFLQNNVVGTQNLLETTRKRGCRMLHVSTDEVYGSIAEGLFTEESPLRPNSPYAASKASADLLVRAYHETYGLDVVVTRCSNNYGPYQFPEKLIPLVISHALEGKPIPVYGDGGNVRDWIHVKDHCRAVAAVFLKGRPGEVYNIGGRNERRNIDIIRQLLAKAAEKTGSDGGEMMKLITFVKDRPGHDRRYAIDPSRIESELGWKAETGFDDGLADTVEWYVANRSWWENIISGEYMKYYRVQYGERMTL
ncbi:MAG: dTDP-glucose 4,6-dehydratase [Candidatus Sulfobium sp.]